MCINDQCTRLIKLQVFRNLKFYIYFLFKENYVNIVRAKFRYMLHGTLYLYLSSVLKKKVMFLNLICL